MPAHVAHPLHTLAPAPNDTPNGAAAPEHNAFPFSHQLNTFDHDRTNLPVRWDSLPTYVMVSTRKHRASRESMTSILVSTGEGVKQAIGNSTLRSYRTKVSRQTILARRERADHDTRGILCSPIDASAPACEWSTNVHQLRPSRCRTLSNCWKGQYFNRAEDIGAGKCGQWDRVTEDG